MKFSIIIPTQDRPSLLAVVVRYAMQIDHPNFEVIVSDNSTSEDQRQSNLLALQKYLGHSNFRIVYPPSVLSPPENFEFALDYATGDYISYLTDKMIILPDTLNRAERAIKPESADIVNWGYALYSIDNIDFPTKSGTLRVDLNLLKNKNEEFRSEKALQLKACGEFSRGRETVHGYVQGKIIFGCYSKTLIDNIRETSKTLFGGATHDYSAMIQALSMAKKSVILGGCGVIFLSHIDVSIGNATDKNSQAALKYFESFSDSNSVLSHLLVPGLYASQHNMVAHDYIKFLPIYGKESFFEKSNWLVQIYGDLISESKIWLNEDEKNLQLELFFDYVALSENKDVLFAKFKAMDSDNGSQRRKVAVKSFHDFMKRVFRKISYVINHESIYVLSLNDAIQALGLVRSPKWMSVRSNIGLLILKILLRRVSLRCAVRR